jgi:hypothetical protein
VVIIRTYPLLGVSDIKISLSVAHHCRDDGDRSILCGAVIARIGVGPVTGDGCNYSVDINLANTEVTGRDEKIALIVQGDS